PLPASLRTSSLVPISSSVEPRTARPATSGRAGSPVQMRPFTNTRSATPVFEGPALAPSAAAPNSVAQATFSLGRCRMPSPFWRRSRERHERQHVLRRTRQERRRLALRPGGVAVAVVRRERVPALPGRHVEVALLLAARRDAQPLGRPGGRRLHAR